MNIVSHIGICFQYSKYSNEKQWYISREFEKKERELKPMKELDERQKVIDALEARQIRFHFTKCPLVLYLKGRCDTKKDKVGDEIKRYYATYQKFTQEEYKNLVKELAPTLIAIQTAKSRIEKAKLSAESPMEATQCADERKQKRANRALEVKKQSLKAGYLSECKQYEEELAYLEVTLNIIVRLCLSAYEYMQDCLQLYIKYVSLSGEEELPVRAITYDSIYAEFISAIKGGVSYEE